jgi:hypothetical protein
MGEFEERYCLIRILPSKNCSLVLLKQLDYGFL